MKTHSEQVKEILAVRKTAVCDQRYVAIAEIDDCSLPWLLRSSYSALLTAEHRQFNIALA
jgi:hypothetical protein